MKYYTLIQKHTAIHYISGWGNEQLFNLGALSSGMRGQVEWQLTANFSGELVYQTPQCHLPQGSHFCHHREYLVDTVYCVNRSEGLDTLIGKETGLVSVGVGGTHTYHRL
jgi:hypothetical protein